ncbi:hypothetical protein T484DRAFT_1781030 [Baffinella frigidus]|nr:hypothetical protein T484DRAFT_1781030 [Cryptophyta sp. CCMP2293]
MRGSALLLALALLCVAGTSAQFFVNLDNKKGTGADVATGGEAGEVAVGGDVAAGTDQAAALQEDWTAFVKWFRSNGGIISSKLTVKEIVDGQTMGKLHWGELSYLN